MLTRRTGVATGLAANGMSPAVESALTVRDGPPQQIHGFKHRS